MIKNERQYRITKAQADQFSQTLDSLRKRPSETEGVHPFIAKAQEDALRSQLADLEEELREYESLKAGKFPMDELSGVAELPTVLIKARIAQGLSQKDLAERLGGAADTALRGHRVRLGQSNPNQGGRERIGCSDEQACYNHRSVMITAQGTRAATHCDRQSRQ